MSTAAFTRPSSSDQASQLHPRPSIEVDWSRVMAAARCFGIETFRPGQRELIEAVLQGRDAVGVLPTGGGRSVCYQLPALLVRGATVIVTPRLALARDPIDHLNNWRIESARLDGSTGACGDGEHDRESSPIGPIMYVTPERLDTEVCIGMLQMNNVVRLIVDEAHCVSALGHDPRPAFRAIRRVAKQLGNPAVLAMTTSANAETAKDIGEQLGMRDPLIVRPGLSRPNLSFEVMATPNDKRKRATVESIVARHDGAGIVYCATVTSAEELHAWLRARGIDAGLYHSKLRVGERQEAQEKFMRGDTRVMVATRAFGPEVDKRDIRFVVHTSFPDSIEAYQEDVNRAGRDGAPATTYLLYRREDRHIQEHFLAARYPDRDHCDRLRALLTSATATVGARSPSTLASLALAAQVPEHALRVFLTDLEAEGLACVGYDEITFGDHHPRTLARAITSLTVQYGKRRTRDRARLRAIMNYAQSTECRAQQLRRYFDDDAGEPCGHCDACRERGAS